MATGPQIPQQARTFAETAQLDKLNDSYKARTGNEDEQSYILAIHADKQHQQRMTSLRNRYFPAKINKLDAHVALFRGLPGSQLPKIKEDIAHVTASQAPFSIHAERAYRIRHGIAIDVVDRSGQAKAMYQTLKSRWSSFLSRQDMSFNAHYTVQNKVEDDAEVEKSLKELHEQFHGSQGQVLGLSLYRYDRGFWVKEKDFLFEGGG